MVLPLRVRASAPAPWREEVERLTGGRTPATGGIEIEVLDYPPHRVSVLLSIAIESPMTSAQHVEAAHVLATRNAPPLLASFRFSELSGRAAAAIRVQLAAEAQDVIVVAELNDGTLRMAQQSVRVFASP